MKRLVVNREKVDMITSVFSKLKYTDETRCYDVYTVRQFGKKDLVFGINWSACGTRTPEETKAFAEHLIKASKFIDTLNSINGMMEYFDEPLYTSKEDYKETEEELTEMIENYEVEDIKNWLFGSGAKTVEVDEDGKIVKVYE